MCCHSWGCKESKKTERLNRTELKLFCAFSFVFFVFLRNLPMVVITLKHIFLSQYFQLHTYFLFHRFILASSFFFSVLGFSFDTFFTWIFSSLELSFHYFL